MSSKCFVSERTKYRITIAEAAYDVGQSPGEQIVWFGLVWFGLECEFSEHRNSEANQNGQKGVHQRAAHVANDCVNCESHQVRVLSYLKMFAVYVQ